MNLSMPPSSQRPPAAGLEPGLRLLAFPLAIFWGYLFFGLIDLTVFLQGPEFHDSFHLETGWGLFFTLLVAAPLLAVAIAPVTLPGAVQQVLLAAAALVVGATLTASPEHLLPAIGVGTTALVIAAAGDSVEVLMAFPRRWPWGPGALVVVVAGPWFAYALTAAERGRAGSHTDIHLGPRPLAGPGFPGRRLGARGRAGGHLPTRLVRGRVVRRGLRRLARCRLRDLPRPRRKPRTNLGRGCGRLGVGVRRRHPPDRREASGALHGRSSNSVSSNNKSVFSNNKSRAVRCSGELSPSAPSPGRK
jgi:hypothetical protein